MDFSISAKKQRRHCGLMGIALTPLMALGGIDDDIKSPRNTDVFPFICVFNFFQQRFVVSSVNSLASLVYSYVLYS